MNKSLLAKILSWAQFGIITTGQLVHALPGSPNWHDYLTIIGSGVLATAVHYASATDGSN